MLPILHNISELKPPQLRSDLATQVLILCEEEIARVEARRRNVNGIQQLRANLGSHFGGGPEHRAIDWHDFDNTVRCQELVVFLDQIARAPKAIGLAKTSAMVSSDVKACKAP
jgi:hypothetical protein